MDFKIGLGFDVHQVEPGNKVLLGGVYIPSSFSLKGHSDADVLLHAITDALLGAVGENDIGFHFPDSEEKNKDRSSFDFLGYAYRLIQKKGFKVSNIDANIICEAPKVNPYREKIRSKVSSFLDLEKEQVNIKATTTEKLGFLGRKEGIVAEAVVLIYKSE